MSPERHHRLARTIVALAAPLVPEGVRADWRQEWDAELAALGDMPAKYRRPMRRAVGAFSDAFWLRQRSIADFDWIDDVRHGTRQLAQHGGFAFTAIGILAVGLAATVTMFSVTDQILLRPLPYSDPDRIVTVWETNADVPEPQDVAPGNFLDWRERARSFEFIAGINPHALDVKGESRPEVWFSAKVTEGFFETFGVSPLAGRFFTPEEYTKGRDNVVVLGERFWRSRFGGDASVVGRTFRTNDGPVTVVGIVPATFEPRVLPTAGGHRDIWGPKAIEEYEPRIRTSGYWAVVGRLKADATLEGSQAELDTISQQLAQEYPASNRKIGGRIIPLRDHLVGNVRLAVALLAGGVAMVLLIACVNVANLLLARGSSREREVAIRVALGARRARIVQQLLTESMVMAVIGAIVGVVLAQWTLSALARLGPQSVPWIETLHLDWRALLFAGAISVAVAVLSGMLPAWRVARVGLANAGRQTTTGDPAQHRLRAGLVVVEVALALVLISGAGLLLRSFVSLMSVDPGFQRDQVLVAQVFAWDSNPTPADLRRFFTASLDRIRALPAVQHVGVVSAMPFIESNINIQGTIEIAGRAVPPAGETPRSHLTVATPGYFDAMRIPLKAGRLLEDRDGADSRPVTVISETLARKHWTSLDAALGQTVRFRFSGQPKEVEIVGVVASLRHDTLDRGAREELFIPHAQLPFGSMTFVVRSAGDATSLLEPVKAAIWDINPGQTIYRSATLDELVRNTVSPRRFALIVVVAFALVALLLAIGGVYGVLTAITRARLREVGVRVALGADWWDIVRWVLNRGLVMTALGIAIGLAGSFGAAQLLRSFLFGIAPDDPVAILAGGTVMLLAAAAACYVPAQRAARTDAVEILRME
jgi:predicted permease